MVAASALALLLLWVLWTYGGVGRHVLPFAILLLLPIYTLVFWTIIGRGMYAVQLRRRPLPAVGAYHPLVSVIIPAFNEAASIAATVHCADLAARLYPGETEILVANDGSTDDTFAIARKAVGGLQQARGQVVDLPHGGKSNALNGMLRVASGEILVRVDADTRMSPETGFAAMVPHFSDPKVGGVQGLILPLQNDGWVRKLRFLEITWNHLFLRRAQMAFHTTQVVDGAYCAFRRKDLLHVGGWVAWNGEDTEITLRLQRLGFRMRFEPGAAAFEDVPANFAQLKKQRVRWTRGGSFAHRRHYGALLAEAPEFGGLAMAFWLTMFARGGVRQMIYVYAVMATLLLQLPTLFDFSVIIALLFVPRAVVMIYYALRMRRPDGVLWLPIWPGASFLKKFFTTEAFGTMLPGAAPEFSE